MKLFAKSVVFAQEEGVHGQQSWLSVAPAVSSNVQQRGITPHGVVIGIALRIERRQILAEQASMLRKGEGEREGDESPNHGMSHLRQTTLDCPWENQF